VDADFMKLEENKRILDEAKKISDGIAGKKNVDGHMRSTISTSHGQYDRATKKLRTVKAPYHYAAVITPTELGRDHAIVVDGVNETLTVFKDVKTLDDGSLDFDKANVAAMYAKSIKLDEDGRARIAEAAEVTIKNANDALKSSYTARKKAAEKIIR
jgi:hypothetical protein